MEVEELLRLIGQQGMRQAFLAMAIMAILTVFREFFTNYLGVFLELGLRKLISWLDPDVKIRFTDDSEDHDVPRNLEAYKAIENYLSDKCSAQARGLKANSVKDISNPVLCVDDKNWVSDEFNGVRVSWYHGTDKKTNPLDFSKKMRYFILTFQRKNREMVVTEYLKQVMKDGQEAQRRRRQQKLYTNSRSSHHKDNGPGSWRCVMELAHPAKFENLAMEDEKKKDIINDLNRFKAGREYYRRIGKPWKRGYLLYGPPGTGKSTLIAAMANFLGYDVYDLELTAVLGNAALKSLIMQTPRNSIIVIEDIDCSGGITGQREKINPDKVNIPVKNKEKEKVTLSGLLNCVDGLFSADNGGRVIVFTTNKVEELDSALVRTGRMDKHIELTYCGIEAFKILAKVYLRIEEHKLFGRIEELLKECSITPADVAETLMERGRKDEDVKEDHYLKKLIGVLEEKVRNEDKLEKKGTGEGGEGGM